MRATDFLEEYRELRARQRVLREALDTFGYDGHPQGTRSANAALAAPRSTNNRDAANAQAFDRISQAARAAAERADAMELLLPQVLDALTDERMKMIVQLYYADGQTDERIASLLFLSPRHVNRLRHAGLDAAEKAGEIAWV